MLYGKVEREKNHIEIGWMPDKKGLEIAFEEVNKRGFKLGDLSTIMITNACDDLSALVSHFYKYLEQKIGSGTANVFKEVIIEHPEMLFAYGDVIGKGDIKDADFY